MLLSSSDIGTDPTTVEGNLTKYFKLATCWNAIVLIDEADVYMERRSSSDLVRNSLVAGFLRALEVLLNCFLLNLLLTSFQFYDGILILTTNRVGSFDDAFISRVHIQLYYPEFTDIQRVQVWETFIKKLQEERGKAMRLTIDAKEYIRGTDMKKLKWNGREIRNGNPSSIQTIRMGLTFSL